MIKKYFNIDEISNIIDEKKHTIRFWEDRLKKINILRTDSGHRLYSYENLLLFKKIKYLINDKKYTLDGVDVFLEKKKNTPYNHQAISLKLKEILNKLKHSSS